MIGRLFWFGVGAGVAVYAVGKVRGYLEQATPQALGQRATRTAAGLTDQVRDFSRRVRAASAEREAELRDVLEGRAEGSGPLGLPE